MNILRFNPLLSSHFINTTTATYKVKVKVTLVQELRLCTGHTADRGVEV
jgi:hypothetical protein